MKKTIRKEIINKRKSLSHEELLEKSHDIFKHLKSLSTYKDAHRVMLYMDFNGEVKTNHILEDLLNTGRTAVIPISIPKTMEMILSEVKNPDLELTPSSYGILEPKPEYIRKVDAKSLDLVLVPGIAFDQKGYRIGYGGGYYDYFFSNAGKSIPSVALAFDFQLMKEVPKESYDRPVDFIVTETRIIKCNNK